MVSALPLDESQISRAAEEMIAEYGDEALRNAGDQINALKSKGFESVAKTWELIREAIDEAREEEAIEPLGEVEQAWLDGWLKIERQRDCHWIDDAGRYCDEPLSQLQSQYPYCEEHLRRSLTEAGWRRVLVSAGRLTED